MTIKLFTNAKNSAERISNFVDDFIRSEHVQIWAAEKDRDFVNEPERAGRVHNAAEFGADGKTHAEVIEDWREAFAALIRDRRAWNNPERFMAGVEKHFDETEAWHEANGSLFQEIG